MVGGNIREKMIHYKKDSGAAAADEGRILPLSRREHIIDSLRDIKISGETGPEIERIKLELNEELKKLPAQVQSEKDRAELKVAAEKAIAQERWEEEKREARERGKS